MPPRATASNKQVKPQGPTKQELEAINDYLAEKPDFDSLIQEAKANPQPFPRRDESEYERALRKAVLEVFEERRKEGEVSRKGDVSMPVLPKDDGSDSNLKDKLTQANKDSNASKDGKDKASIQHHQANPGPVIAENLPEAASKEESRKRAEELNKK